MSSQLKTSSRSSRRGADWPMSWPRSSRSPATTPTYGPGSAGTAASRTLLGRPTSTRSRLSQDRKSTRLNSSHTVISYAVFCLKKKTQHHTVIVAGVAGLIADALSMGSSGYLAAKSEQEVYAHEIAMERDEIELMPEVERDELALIYEAKGMDSASVLFFKTQVIPEPNRFLQEQVQAE